MCFFVSPISQDVPMAIYPSPTVGRLVPLATPVNFESGLVLAWCGKIQSKPT